MAFPIVATTGMFRGDSVSPGKVVDLQGLLTISAATVAAATQQAAAAGSAAAVAATAANAVPAAAASAKAAIAAQVAAATQTLAATINSFQPSAQTAVTAAAVANTALAASTAAQTSANTAGASATAATTTANTASATATAASATAATASAAANTAITSAAAANTAIAAVQAAAVLAGTATTATATTATLAALKVSYIFDIRTYGAACNGVADDGPAIQRAIDAATAAGGGTVLFPASIIRWNAQVSVTGASVRLLGAGWSEDVTSGTRIITTVPSTILQFAGTGCRGSSVRGMSFQQVHPAQGPGWAPTAYPPTILIFNCNGQITIDDVFCLNCYDFIRSLGSGRTKIGSIYGQPLHRGLYIDGSYDTTHVDHIHFWPYWTPAYLNADGTRNPGSYVIDWMYLNGAAIELARCDGFQAAAVFCFGYGDGLKLSYSTLYAPNSGTTTLAQIGAFYPDSCTRGVNMAAPNASAHIDSLYTGGENLLNAAIPNAVAIYFSSINCQLSVSNAKLFFTDAYAMIMDQPAGGNILLVGNLEMTLINQGATLVPTLMFSANTTTPNIIRIANTPLSLQNRGQAFLNQCNARCSIPGLQPYIVAPVSGGVVNVIPSRDLTLIEPAGVLASLSVALPASHTTNGDLTVVSTQDITAVSWNAGATPIVAPPAGLKAGKSVKFKFLSGAEIAGAGVDAWFSL